MLAFRKRGWTNADIGSFYSISETRVRQVTDSTKRSVYKTRCYLCQDFIKGKHRFTGNHPIDEGCYIIVGSLMRQRSVKIPLRTAIKIMKTIFDDTPTEAPEEEATEEAKEESSE